MTAQASGFKPGDVKPWPGTTAPAGWIKANGALVSRTAYAALFAVIGTTFGAGDGSTTFALPDLRGEFIRGLDDGRGVDSGRGLGTFQAGDMASHNHNISGYVSQSQITCSGGGGWAGVGFPYMATSSSVIQAAGGAENRPRNIAMLNCIKY
jgi:microcystin-dependent protein